MLNLEKSENFQTEYKMFNDKISAVSGLIGNAQRQRFEQVNQ